MQIYSSVNVTYFIRDVDVDVERKVCPLYVMQRNPSYNVIGYFLIKKIPKTGDYDETIDPQGMQAMSQAE